MAYKKALTTNNIEVPKEIAVTQDEMNSEFGKIRPI